MKIKLLSTIILIVSIVFTASIIIKYYKGRDMLGPVINIDNEELTVSVNDPLSQTLEGVTAYDAKDGDVTDMVIVEGLSDFVEKNTRIATYIAFDKDNHTTQATRRIIYNDYTPPQFGLTGALKFPISYTGDFLSKVTLWDCLDGDISGMVHFTEDSVINANIPGTYKVAVEGENSAGEIVKLPLTIETYETQTGAEIYLKNYLVYINVGEDIYPESYIDHVVYGNKEYAISETQTTFAVDTENMSKYEKEILQEMNPCVKIQQFDINNMVNTHIPGVYEIHYSLQDLNKNTGTVTLTVVVKDNS